MSKERVTPEDFIGAEFRDRNYPDAVCEIAGIMYGFYVVMRRFPGGPNLPVFMSAKEINESQKSTNDIRQEKLEREYAMLARTGPFQA